MITRFARLGCLALFVLCPTVSAEEPTSCIEDPVSDLVSDMIADLDPPGVVLRVAQDGRLLYDRAFGRYDADTVINIASSTKWVTSAVIMTLVDDGLIALDAPISRYLPDVTGPLADATMAQLLSHTSGIGGLQVYRHHLSQPVDMQLVDAGREIAQGAPEHAPGTAFDYGGASFQLAGAIAEKVSGRSWHELFDMRVAQPLGMTASFYGHPMPVHQDRKGLSNPGMGGGLHTSLNEYWRFLSMITHYGETSDERVLSKHAIQTMETNRVGALKIVYTPRTEDQQHFRYGLGVWCEAFDQDDRCSVVSSPGAWGTYPWIDRNLRQQGMLMIQGQSAQVSPWVARLRRAINTAIKTCR